MLDVDTTRPFKQHAQLQALVEAVYSADVHDELDWIEWKREVALETADGRGTIARHILGMANRKPDVAQRAAGGYGYIIVGVEPGNCAGQTSIDPSVLEPAIQQYLSAESGPVWMATWLAYRGKQVLVVTIDPPAQGHPIHALEKQFAKYDRGDVFVRRPGRTVKATPEDIRWLTLRAHEGVGDRLAVELVPSGDRPLTVIPVHLSDAGLDAWLADRRRELLAPLERQLAKQEDAERSATSTRGFTDRLISPSIARAIEDATRVTKMVETMGIFGRPEDRTPDQYRNRVDEYIEELREVALEVAVDRHLDSGAAVLDLQVANPTDHPFRAVEVVLHVPGSPVIGADGPERLELPAPPRRWGSRRGLGLDARILAAPPVIPAAPMHFGPSVVIENSGSTTFRFPAVDIGPQDRQQLDGVHLLVGDIYAGTVVEATWEARSVHTSGVSRGELPIAVAASPVFPLELLNHLAAEDGEEQGDD